MKLSRKLTVPTVIVGSLLTAFGAVGIANADPTQGRIEKRERSQKLAQYHECAGFALRVYKAALSQAGDNSAKVRAARTHYQGNLSRCRARFL